MSDIGERIGVLGGSFDPIHLGHLIMAESVRDALSLDRVLFVPAREQPLKQGRHVTPAEQRVAMVELAISGNPHFTLSRVEVDRPGPSFTVDTLRLLGAEGGSAGWGAMWFIVGADSLMTIGRWRDPEGILAQARLAVVRRPGVTPDLSELESGLPQLPTRIDWIESPLIGISATDIRRRIAEGRSIRYHVPSAVREYIERGGLYG